MNDICNVCPNHCNIEDNSICKQKPTTDNKNMIYTSAVALDPIEKKPLYHFQPGTQTLSIGTVGCNLKCLNCQNHSIAQPKEAGDVSTKLYTPQDIVSLAKFHNLTSISWTYNEPTIHPEWIIQTAKLARNEKIKSILVTNGYSSRETLESLVDYVDAVNVDIKSMNEEFYQKVCKARLEPVLESVKFYYTNEVHVELTNLIIPGYNDSNDDFKSLISFVRSLSNYIPLHFTRFYPQFKMNDVDITPLKTVERACNLAKYMGLKYVYPGNVPSSYLDNTYCRNCRHLLIGREGYDIKLNINNKESCNNCNHKVDVKF